MKNKKVRGYVLYVFIITILFFGCMNLKTHIGDTLKHSSIAAKELEVKRSFKNGAENFVFLLKEMHMPVPDPDMCIKMPIFCEKFIGSTASGIVLSSDKASIAVLTAAHFCLPTQEEAMFKEKIIGVAGDQPREMMILAVDEDNDLCLLIGAKKKSDNFKSIKIAKDSIVGEEVYTVAAPLGIGGAGIRLIFEGHLSGCNIEGCMTTIPATFGSSGAGILNSKGELITIVMAVPENFDHVVISPSNSAVINFILDIDAEVDIYPY